MKKLVALILCAAMCLSFAGCGGEEAPASTPAGSSGAEETSVSGEIEILLHKVEINEIMNTMIEEFNKEYPDVKVVLNAPGDTGTVLQARAVANDMPDIVTFPYNNSDLAYARDGFYMDLTNEAFMQENVTPAALESNKIDGVNYSLPYISNAYGVYYNVDIFEENGIEIPTTMDELYAACEKLQAAGVTPIAFSDQELWTLGHLGDRLMGLIFDDDGTLFQQIAAGEATATEHEGMRTVAEVYLKLHEYGQPDSLGVGYEQAISAFANGEAAMMLQGTWLLSLVKSANPDMNVDVFPLPGMTAEETRVGINMDLGLAISETSENKEAALAFLAWMSEAENAQKFADMEGSPSLLNGVEVATPEFAKMAELISEGKSFIIPRGYWAPSMVNELQNALQRLVSSKDVDQFLKELDEGVKVAYAQG